MAPPEGRALACISDSLVKQPAGKRQRSGKSLGTRPPSVLSAPKAIEEDEAPQDAGAEAAAPMAALRLGRSLHRKGPPAHDAGRRALRRFTAVISVEPSPTRSGHACPSGSQPATGGPAGSLLTGRIARKVESRAPRGVRLIRPDPQAPLPAPPMESPR